MARSILISSRDPTGKCGLTSTEFPPSPNAANTASLFFFADPPGSAFHFYAEYNPSKSAK